MRKIFFGFAIFAFLLSGAACQKAAEKQPAAEKKAAAKAEAPAKKVEKNYWADWTPGMAKGPMPDCGVNVLPLGGDDILQATVDLYCGLKPGAYKSYINPAVMEIYNSKGSDYPDGRTAVLVFPKIGAFFSTDHKDGKPIYNVYTIAEEKSIASNEPGHPLNPATCEKCHAEFDGACAKYGFVCGNRF